MDKCLDDVADEDFESDRYDELFAERPFYSRKASIQLESGSNGFALFCLKNMNDFVYRSAGQGQESSERTLSANRRVDRISCDRRIENEQQKKSKRF